VCENRAVAVVGMACRVPGAADVQSFWRNVCDGVESITFFSDADLTNGGVDARALADPNYVRAGGALAGVDLFDASFFGFTPRDAERTDPQHRLLIECAWEALEHAGCITSRRDTRIGVFAYVDSRDSRTGPRSGHLFGARYREYWDVGRKTFAFRQSEFEFQQYLPYFNRSRVIAVRAAAVLSYPKGDNQVPLYLQPTLGGNDDLRGFGAYRFRDVHSFLLSAEHRWHVSSLLDMSAFVDGGKVVPLKRDVNPESLHYSGGVGFRVRLGAAVVNRIDFAGSAEGFRMSWTFSDIYSPRWW